jgi:Flp pilus assembly protein TadD
LLDQRIPDDPVISVCLLVLYQLIESSKIDQFVARISQLSGRLAKSPNIIAAEALLDVHDTYLSEIILNREQVQNGRSRDLLVLLARFCQQNKEFSRAEEYLREAIELDREDLVVWKTLSRFQYESGAYNRALESCEQLLGLMEVSDPEVCLRLALITIRFGNYEKAFDLLMFTVQKLDNNIAWMALGVCCLRKGDYEQAEVALSQAN